MIRLQSPQQRGLVVHPTVLVVTDIPALMPSSPLSPGLAGRAVPVNLAKLAHVLQLSIAQLDRRTPDDPRIEAQSLPYRVLCGDAAVKPHDEVVAACIPCLVDGQGSGQAELAPVGDGADDAARGEDDVAGGEDDSRRGKSAFQIPVQEEGERGNDEGVFAYSFTSAKFLLGRICGRVDGQISARFDVGEGYPRFLSARTAFLLSFALH